MVLSDAVVYFSMLVVQVVPLTGGAASFLVVACMDYPARLLNFSSARSHALLLKNTTRPILKNGMTLRAFHLAHVRLLTG